MTIQTMAFEARANVVFVYHGASNPSDEEWGQVVDAMVTVLESADEGAYFVVTEGGGPNAAQRQQMSALLRPGKVRVAVVSDSTVVRGMVTALAWLGSLKINAFSPSHMSAACKFVSPSLALGVAEQIIADLAQRVTAPEPKRSAG